jgi:hypothetical protein
VRPVEAVTAVAVVVGGAAGRGRVSQERAFAGVHRREAFAADAALPAERIIAAGVEHHDLQVCAAAFHLLQDLSRLDAAIAREDFVLRLKIDGRKVVLAIDLHGVAGVVKERDVALAERADEAVDGEVYSFAGSVDDGWTWKFAARRAAAMAEASLAALWSGVGV